jgi:hypothetical protein
LKDQSYQRVGLAIASKLKKAIDTFWKIYFWAFLILMLTAFAELGLNKVWLIIDLVFSIVGMIGLFSYAYKRKVFTAIFWKLFFPVLLVWHFLYSELIYPTIAEANYTIGVRLLGLSVWMPVYIALYFYAFRFFRKDMNM